MNIYVLINNKTIGPYTVDEVRSRIVSGQFTGSELGHIEGASEWQTVNCLIESSSSHLQIKASSPLNVYVFKYGEKHGPYTVQELNSFLDHGHFLETDLAFYEGQGNLVPLLSVPGIFSPSRRQSIKQSPIASLFSTLVINIHNITSVFWRVLSIIGGCFGFALPPLIWYFNIRELPHGREIDGFKMFFLGFLVSSFFAFCGSEAVVFLQVITTCNMKSKLIAVLLFGIGILITIFLGYKMSLIIAFPWTVCAGVLVSAALASWGPKE